MLARPLAVMALMLGLVVIALRCSVATTPTSTVTPVPTPTHLPLHVEELEVTGPRQLTIEGEGIQRLLWWSDDAREFIVAREPSQVEQMTRSHGGWNTCGEDSSGLSHIWRVRDDGERQYLGESYAEASVSPDGHWLVYAASVQCENESRFIRSLRVLDLRLAAFNNPDGSRQPGPLPWPGPGASRALVDVGPQRITSPWLGPDAMLLRRDDGYYRIDVTTGESRKLEGLPMPTDVPLPMWPSPDGKFIAYRALAGGGQAAVSLRVVDIDSGAVLLDRSEGATAAPAWSWDSKRLAWMPEAGSKVHIETFAVGGVSEGSFDLPADPEGRRQVLSLWSKDGGYLVFRRIWTTGAGIPHVSLFAVNADGTGAKDIATPDVLPSGMTWSEDGSILFMSSTTFLSGAGQVWAMGMDEVGLNHRPSGPVSLYVRADPASVAPGTYVYLEPEDVPDALKLEASPEALRAQGMTVVHDRQELETAVWLETKTIVINREGAPEVDPAWLRAQYEAGKRIYGLWLTGEDLKRLYDAQLPMTFGEYTPGGRLIAGHLEKNSKGTPSYGTASGDLQTEHLTLYGLMQEVSRSNLSLRDIMNDPRRPGAPAPTPTSLPTATPVAAPTATPTPTGTRMPPPTAVPGPQSLPGPRMFDVEGQAEKPVYLRGERLSIQVTFKNTSGQALLVENFPGIVALDLVDTAVDEGRPLVLDQGPRTLASGEVATVQLEAPPELSAVLSPGRYTLRTHMRLGRENNLDFGLGVIFTLLPPQGALEKTVAVGEAREVDGVKMTLERVEFTAEKTRVVALAVPEGYRPTVELGPAGGPHASPARYRVGEGEWQPVNGGSSRETPEGVHLEWEVAPVAADAASFAFAVTSFSVDPGRTVSGPWEWTVPLQGR